MTMDDAIRILDPQHKLTQDEGLAEVEEACRIAIEAMKKLKEMEDNENEEVDN